MGQDIPACITCEKKKKNYFVDPIFKKLDILKGEIF
jgi:hypothetical protein